MCSATSSACSSAGSMSSRGPPHRPSPRSRCTTARTQSVIWVTRLRRCSTRAGGSVRCPRTRVADQPPMRPWAAMVRLCIASSTVYAVRGGVVWVVWLVTGSSCVVSWGWTGPVRAGRSFFVRAIRRRRSGIAPSRTPVRGLGGGVLGVSDRVPAARLLRGGGVPPLRLTRGKLRELPPLLLDRPRLLSRLRLGLAPRTTRPDLLHRHPRRRLLHRLVHQLLGGVGDRERHVRGDQAADLRGGAGDQH